jgi:hypothetical protein
MIYVFFYMTVNCTVDVLTIQNEYKIKKVAIFLNFFSRLTKFLRKKKMNKKLFSLLRMNAYFTHFSFSFQKVQGI